MQSDVPRPGDLVWIRQRRWRVERARRERGVVRLDVASKGERLTFLAPFDRPTIAGDSEAFRRVRPQSARARLAGLIANTFGMRTLPCVSSARVEILPHQLEPALALLHGARRILIADDVGLGKTIQAGIVIAEVLARDPAARVLVCAPGALRDQWAGELLDRFGIESVTADRRTLDALAREGAFGDSPWRRAGVWLASLDFLKQPHVIEALPRQPWDLVVIDEAHDACGESERHAAAVELTWRSRRVLLMTATPHSGDTASFRRLTGLGGLDGGADALTVFRRTRADLGMNRARRVRWRRITLHPAEARALALLMSYEATVLRAAGAARRDRALLLLSIFRKRALSTMASLVASLQRRLLWLDGLKRDAPDWTQPLLAFDQSAAAAEDDSGSADALMADVGLDTDLERRSLQRILNSAAEGARRESKLSQIARLLARHSEPVVVFTEFRDSLQALTSRLQTVRTMAVLHGGMRDSERTEQLNAFLRGEATVLAATDVAGQGLNLQSRARWVISLELPWNPAKLEQRIGRVDRIGQQRPVHFTLLIARGDAESGVLARVARRMLAARQALGGGIMSAIAPGESQLRTALLAGGAAVAAPSPAPLVMLCRRWRRHARVVTRRAIQSRRLAARWRGPAPAGAVWTTKPAGAGMQNATLVFSVPLVSAIGDVVERHVVAVHVASLSRSSPKDVRAVAIDAARERAAHRLRARAARLTRVRAALAALSADTEQALAARLDARVPHEVQSGLFDRRGERALAAAHAERQAITTLVEERGRDRDAGAAVHVGRPALVIAFLAP